MESRVLRKSLFALCSAFHRSFSTVRLKRSGKNDSKQTRKGRDFAKRGTRQKNKVEWKESLELEVPSVQRDLEINWGKGTARELAKRGLSKYHETSRHYPNIIL